MVVRPFLRWFRIAPFGAWAKATGVIARPSLFSASVFADCNAVDVTGR
jgi:hypothetical protein